MEKVLTLQDKKYVRLTWLAKTGPLSYSYLYQSQHILKTYFGLRILYGHLYIEKTLAEEFVQLTKDLIPFVDVKGLPRKIKDRNIALDNSGYQVIMGFAFVTNIRYSKKRFAKRRE